jgi:hypothetical protein
VPSLRTEGARPASPPSLDVLVVNWQDRENPQAGGAEAHLHEVFGRLARSGHRVTLLCSGFEGAPSRATLDGIEVHRVGGRHSFAALARRYFARHLARHPFDVVVEDLNKIPLFTPRWTDRPVVPLAVGPGPSNALVGRTLLGSGLRSRRPRRSARSGRHRACGHLPPGSTVVQLVVTSDMLRPTCLCSLGD